MQALIYAIDKRIRVSLLFFFFSLLFFSITLSAKNVTLKTASQVALNVFAEKSGISKSKLKIKDVIPVENADRVLYRIFNFTPIGYIVITADDNAEPLIGYGLSSNFSFDDAPPSLLFLLGEYKAEMKGIIKNNLKATVAITAKWQKYSDENYIFLKSYTIGTYLLGTNWGQDSPYNDSCPLDPNTGNRCLVGCTAVAMGQILNYWTCKVFPDDTRTYYPNQYFTNPLTVNFYDQVYDWNAINNTPSATAQFLYHCGVAIGVDYTDSATGGYSSDVDAAMQNYFGFQTSGLKSKNSYSSSAWITMLKSDIDAGRPIYYDGTNTTVTPNVAHAWVIDGYRTSDEFHCNWGWRGTDNDWYYLNDLTPGSGNYNSYQHAITGAEPILDACSGLSGATYICSTKSYSVSIPSIASVTWSKSANLNQVGSNTGTTYTVSKGSDGSGSVTATIKNSRGQTFLTRTKSVWAGILYPPLGISIQMDAPPHRFTASTSDDPYATSYNWYLNGVMNDLYHDSGCIFNRVSPYCGGQYYVQVEAVDSCGVSSKTALWVFEPDCLYLLQLTPNPMSTESTVELVSETGADIDTDVAWDMEVYDSSQLLKEKQSGVKGKNTKLNTSNWKEGVYIVRANYNGNILTNKLVVKH